MSWLSELFKNYENIKSGKKQILYQNRGTFRTRDQYYFITQTGKGKIVYDLIKTLRTRIPPSSQQAKNEQQ
jgi:hypothetical protein